MAYPELEEAKILSSSIQIENTDPSQYGSDDRADMLNDFKSLWRQLGDPDIESYGLRRLVASYERRHSVALSQEVRDIMRIRIHGILEKQIEKWFLSGNDQVYNVLDILLGFDNQLKSEILDSCDRKWFNENRNRFWEAAKHGYELAIKHNNIGVANQITELFPEFTTDEPH
jgi:hypothetical protein